MILRDQDIFLEGIQLAVEIKFFTTVVALRPRRQHLNDERWVQQNIGLLVLHIDRTANDRQVGIGVEAVGADFDTEIGGERFTEPSLEGVAKLNREIHRDAGMFF